MFRSCLLVLLLALAGCPSSPPPHTRPASPCVPEEASYDCQVERYHNVNAP
ncbi:hypothetical protein JJB11_24210 [Ramlibacter ginsenosidimutans]|uniref:Lipoprotein n=1 Tax=Ramlibacter ginsenosidimutans TaxID=502333 RepID=A0A934WNS5_9BURK|nr:hypothetical protein [Ramlibacter ginsenosidimutans]MBK6009214.1 hypothetical protein [Ramlibacter ginsenosidimutans]